MKKKILILGNSAKEYALAKKLSEENEIYCIPGNTAMSEFAECVDIRVNSVFEILEFVLENSVDMTVAASEEAISTDIADIFEKNNLKFFAPSKNSARITLDKVFAKKLMYRLKIPTPKFGVFEKQNMLFDYINRLGKPFVLKTNNSLSAVVFTDLQSAKLTIDSMFLEKNQKIIVEDYIYGTPFTFYAITDGYNALPINSAVTYKHSLDGEGGQLTSGMGACVPNFKLSLDAEAFLMNDVIYPTIDFLEREGTPYCGIIGINGIIDCNEKINILGYQNFLQDSDCAAIIDSIDCDIYELFNSCIIGSFSDDYEYIPIKEKSYVSIVLRSKNEDKSENIIEGINTEEDDDDLTLSFFNNAKKNRYLEYYAEKGNVLVLTAKANTISLAREKAYKNVKHINFKGIGYRTDIGN